MACTHPDARELSSEALEALRMRALPGCEMGFTEAHVADLLGVRRESVSRQWPALAGVGLDAFPHYCTGRLVGTGRTLSVQQAQQIQQQLVPLPLPEDLDFPATLWNQRTVKQLIRNALGIVMPIRTVGSYLQRLGYTPKRPRRHANKQDPEEIRLWLEETHPALEQRATEERATIHWCGGTGVRADQHRARGYAPVDKSVAIDASDTHIGMNQIATVSNAGAIRFTTYARTMTAALLLVFLRQLLRSTVGKLFVITDRLRAHMAPEVTAWAVARRDRIELPYLPTYAPGLNATEEYLNNDLKGQVNATGLPATKKELRSPLQQFMSKLRGLPRHDRNCFLAPVHVLRRWITTRVHIACRGNKTWRAPLSEFEN